MRTREFLSDVACATEFRSTAPDLLRLPAFVYNAYLRISSPVLQRRFFVELFRMLVLARVTALCGLTFCAKIFGNVKYGQLSAQALVLHTGLNSPNFLVKIQTDKFLSANLRNLRF